MSAPSTNTEKQARRHKPALIGIAVAVIVGLAFFLLNLNSVDGDGPIIDEAADGAAVPATGD